VKAGLPKNHRFSGSGNSEKYRSIGGSEIDAEIVKVCIRTVNATKADSHLTLQGLKLINKFNFVYVNTTFTPTK